MYLTENIKFMYYKEVNMTTKISDRLFDKQLAEMETIVKNGQYNAIVPLINIFLEDQEFDKKEAELDLVQYRNTYEWPEGTIRDRIGDFDAVYVIDWSRRFTELNFYDVLTEGMLKKIGIRKDDLKDLALKNLSKGSFMYRSPHYTAEGWTANDSFEYHIFEMESNVAPSYNCSMLYLDNLWKNFYKKVGMGFYICPFFRDYVFVVTDMEYLKNPFAVDFLKRVPLGEGSVPFTDNIYHWDEDGLRRCYF